MSEEVWRWVNNVVDCWRALMVYHVFSLLIQSIICYIVLRFQDTYASVLLYVSQSYSVTKLNLRMFGMTQ